MCDPTGGIATAAILSTAGGLISANGAASNQAAAINAKNQGEANLIQQENGLQSQGTNIFNKAFQPYQDSTPTQTLAPAQASNTAAISNNAPTAAMLAGGATTGNAPQVVKDNESSTIASRLAQFNKNDTALGNLTGYDSVNQNAQRNLKGTADQLGTIGNFATQDASVGNAQTQAAITNSQKAPSPFGEILSGLGGLSAYTAGKGTFPNLSGNAPVPTTSNLNFYG